MGERGRGGGGQSVAAASLWKGAIAPAGRAAGNTWPPRNDAVPPSPVITIGDSRSLIGNLASPLVAGEEQEQLFKRLSGVSSVYLSLDRYEGGGGGGGGGNGEGEDGKGGRGKRARRIRFEGCTLRA